MQLTDKQSNNHQTNGEKHDFLAKSIGDKYVQMHVRVPMTNFTKSQTRKRKRAPEICQRMAESSTHQVSESKWSNTCETRSRQRSDFQ